MSSEKPSKFRLPDSASPGHASQHEFIDAGEHKRYRIYPGIGLSILRQYQTQSHQAQKALFVQENDTLFVPAHMFNAKTDTYTDEELEIPVEIAICPIDEIIETVDPRTGIQTLATVQTQAPGSTLALFQSEATEALRQAEKFSGSIPSDLLIMFAACCADSRIRQQIRAVINQATLNIQRAVSSHMDTDVRVNPEYIVVTSHANDRIVFTISDFRNLA